MACAVTNGGYNIAYMPEFDIVGVGLNATDTLLIVTHFPAYAGKVPFVEEILSPGGQVASAMVACSSLGLRTKYIGTLGDDERGRIQIDSLRGTGINLDRRHCAARHSRTLGVRGILDYGEPAAAPDLGQPGGAVIQ